MKNLSLTKEGNVFVVTMINGSTGNTFTKDVLDEHLAVCDEIEQSTENGAVILTSNDPKFWTNGINLEWLMSQGGDYIPQFKDHIDKMLLRWALLRYPTIACINGHAFGGGAILACCFDFRFMRQDRGFFCFPEVDVNIPFTDVMHGIIDCLPNKQALWELALTGKRIGGEEAKKMGVVSDSLMEPQLLPKAMELAQMLAAKDRATYTSIKLGLKRT
ncbi:MAG: hypothetical protein ACD_73C00318G0002 [uncultured bacterium]|nr:MAG: hypothetical protein ACD_73C00318G0002 [uncultured bacterium]